MNTSTNSEASFNNSRMQAELLVGAIEYSQQQRTVDDTYVNNNEDAKKSLALKLCSVLFAGTIAASAALVIPASVSKAMPLTAEIANSDLNTAVSELWQMHPGSNEVNAQRFLDRFRLDNGLFKNSDLGWYTSIWPSSVALEALYCFLVDIFA
jgi:hypothetical protein